MKNVFGNNLTLTLFGESHGKAIGAVLDGITPGLDVDEDFVRRQLSKRKPRGTYETARREDDDFAILSGVFEGKTTGTPLTVVIENKNTVSGDYAATRSLARPSHADFTAYEKYRGYEDFRGGGHFSGRITAAIVAVGAILIKALEKKGLFIGTHILKLGKISDRPFSLDAAGEVKSLSGKEFPVLDDVETEMTAVAEEAAKDGDSVGGVLQTAITGIPAGVGEPWFDSVEGVIAKAFFAVGGVKGVSFGKGFDLTELRGSEANDPFRVENGRVITTTNNAGGINGGITNGMPVIVNTAIKPTSSIFKEQQTVDIGKLENATLKLRGRHDPAIVRRAAVVLDSMSAISVCDLLITRFGTDYLL